LIMRWHTVAHAGRHNADDRLIDAMARGMTNGVAATAAGISVRTAQRRVNDPEFVQRVRKTRAEMLDSCVGRMAGAAGDAVEVLHELIGKDQPARLRLLAARSILELFPKLQQMQEMEQRLANLEALAKERLT